MSTNPVGTCCIYRNLGQNRPGYYWWTFQVLDPGTICIRLFSIFDNSTLGYYYNKLDIYGIKGMAPKKSWLPPMNLGMPPKIFFFIFFHIFLFLGGESPVLIGRTAPKKWFIPTQKNKSIYYFKKYLNRIFITSV